MQLIDHMKCYLLVERENPRVIYHESPVENIDAIIPRIGASVSFFGIAVVRQFEMMKVFTVSGADALMQARSKFQATQILSMSGIPVPKTAFPHYTQDIRQVIAAVGGPPVVIKVLEGTHGLGVVLAETQEMAESIIETLYKLKARFVVQEFIRESSGQDIRAFVVGDEVVAAMTRRARPGDFRSNLHRGGNAVATDLTPIEKATAIRAAKAVGLPVAGVDMLISHSGPLVLEVNSSPGLEGIEKATGIDVSTSIFEHLEKQVKPASRTVLLPNG
jgi:ribosomal protein S6--L-glutamate ligase